jgi:hypothetical protein
VDFTQKWLDRKWVKVTQKWLDQKWVNSSCNDLILGARMRESPVINYSDKRC